MIEIKNLSKSFDDIRVLDNLTCQINDGTIFGIVGSNGAGKSTLLRMISGVYDTKEGGVFYDGVNLGNKLHNAPDILFLSDEIFYERSDTIDSMAKRYKMYYKNFDYTKFEKLLSMFNLNKKKRIEKLSKGMKKQALLSAALACNAKYLLLDETLDGLDPLMRINAKKLIFDETIKRKMITVITSHSLKELEDMCDSLLMIHGGKSLINGAIDDIRKGLIKVRCAFETPLTKEDFSKIHLQFFNKNGKLYTIIAKGDTDDILKKINKLNPILLEVLPITVEEIFVIKLQQLGYGKQFIMEEK